MRLRSNTAQNQQNTRTKKHKPAEVAPKPSAISAVSTQMQNLGRVDHYFQVSSSSYRTVGAVFGLMRLKLTEFQSILREQTTPKETLSLRISLPIPVAPALQFMVGEPKAIS